MISTRVPGQSQYQLVLRLELWRRRRWGDVLRWLLRRAESVWFGLVTWFCLVPLLDRLHPSRLMAESYSRQRGAEQEAQQQQLTKMQGALAGVLTGYLIISGNCCSCWDQHAMQFCLRWASLSTVHTARCIFTASYYYSGCIKASYHLVVS